MSRSKSLGILILSGPERPDLETATRLARDALPQGINVEIFLMGDGVYHVVDPIMKTLADEGAQVTFCAQNASERALSLEGDDIKPLKEGSQYDLSCIVRESDRFIAFT